MHSDTITDFCRFLRSSGFNAGVLETLAAVDAARVLEPAGLAAVQQGLRTSVCTSKEEWDAFDGLFEAFLAGETGRQSQRSKSPQTSTALLILNATGDSSEHKSERDGKIVSGASPQEGLLQADLGDVPHHDQAALERLAQRLFRQASSRWWRRLKIADTRIALDLRRTIRRSVGWGGEMFDLCYKGRKPKKPSLAVLLNVSGSMNPYSVFLLRFTHALQNQFRRAHTFVFSTRLVEITRELRRREIAGALKTFAMLGVSWSGGTKIGESLETFNALYARKALSRDTLFLILSDGWDTGDPAHLTSQLAAIKPKVRRIIWLNPLLGLPDYRPETRSMAAALPYLDLFAPAHSLESLLQLEGKLC